MKTWHREHFFKHSLETLEGILDHLNGLPDIKLNDIQGGSTALLIIDMINGFAREGTLQSPRVEALIPGITKLSEACNGLGIAKIAFADHHGPCSPEFSSYPPHCMAGTSEGEVVDEIKAVGGYTLIPKNSTNGFLEPVFQKWLDENKTIDTFLVVGDCTDICIQQFAITLKTWFNRQDRVSRVIVPAESVGTYDLGLHNGDLMHVMALYNMIGNGVEVVGRILLD